MTASATRPVSRARWAGRVAVAISIVLAGAYAASQSLALTVGASATDLASRLAPSDARILAFRAKALTEGTPGSGNWTEATRLARQALLRDPLSGSAATTIGLYAATRNDYSAAAAALAYAQRNTRRDLRTNLWAIEYSVIRNDIPGTLRNYDIALKTSSQAPDILFPVLGGAIADAPIRQALLSYLAKRPVWMVPFVRYVAEAAPDHKAGALLFADMRRRAIPLPGGAEASLLGSLVTDRDYATARSYLTATGVPVDRSRHPTFDGNPVTASPFDWNVIDGAGVSAGIQHDDATAVFTFSADGGPILRQLQLLPPGQYTVSSTLSLGEPAAAVPSWTVQCLDGPQLARLPLKHAAADAKPVENGTFTVSDDCPAQWFTLVLPMADLAGEVEGEVRYAAIRRRNAPQ